MDYVNDMVVYPYPNLVRRLNVRSHRVVGGEGYCMEHAVSNGTLKPVSVPQKPASV